MKELIAASLKFQAGKVRVLDQYLLPHQEVWHTCEDVASMQNLINNLQVRGAPLIGLAATLLVAYLAEQGANKQALGEAINALEATRPTAVNLKHCMDTLRQALRQTQYVAAIVHRAEQLFEEDVTLCQRIGEHGVALVDEGDNILTHCNTGALATAGVGTALGVIYTAAQQLSHLHVWVDETRPLLQGGRLTAYELARWQIPYTVLCDNMAAALMAAGKVDKVFVGADRIAANGDFANKVGTYNLAVLAHYHDIPFYVVAPRTTFDATCAHGADIEIEQRSHTEVTGVSGSFGECQWAPENTPVFNPAFDVTPASLVTAWVFDSGIYHEPNFATI
ncbi:S-methyl-5-thioribose-1-phosphate isomerase [Pseudoalteromonas sp. SMS1]|uniref:S-methyl-5-thioribose-1-phosphate isomerase n=1 Tax=Pseudoalteromonas sp. SMS1 TaxID=2908894 RepID=UPI001F3D7B36|nr:S-methyl-5-thioribose-1-phosphate isomerase [Pseudoalteromonas sp. SMS1]MCF2859692.1 S-methyl-5-thioribose-1-phosphate isomerase [Pseudoalteromonas sp. SMS1]